MKRWIAVGAVAGAGALALRRGLHTVPDALEPYGGDTPPLQNAPIPSGLPEPVARYLEVVVGDSLPLVNTAVFSGRMTMRIKGPALPGRWRFSHEVGTGYRHHMELTAFGRPVVTAEEWYLDGHAKLDLPTGVVEGEPRVDRAANLGMWAEYLWMPSALVDPRARWEPIDAVSARLVVPQTDGPDALVAWFDPQTGLVDRFEAERWRDAADPEPVRWVTRVHAWTRIHGIGVPAVSSVQWGDQAQPWLRLSLDEVVWNTDVAQFLRATGA